MMSLALLGFLHVYIGARLLQPLPVLWQMVGAVGLVLLVLTVASIFTPFFGRRRPEGVQALLGYAAMGFDSSLFVLTLLRDLLLLLAWGWSLLGPNPGLNPAPDSDFVRYSAMAVPIAALLASLLGFINARRRPRVRDVDVPIAHLPSALQGFSIVQLTDIHVGPTIRRPFVQAVVDRANALQADMVAVTGDIVDGSVPDLSEHTAPLGQLRARHGVFAVTGNHEYYSGAQAWIDEFSRLGMKVLINEHVVLQHGSARIAVAGVPDYAAHHFNADHRSEPAKALRGAPPRIKVKLLLAHQPRTATAAAEAGFSLQLSGHTHGGQFLPWRWFVPLQQPYTAGLHRLDGLWVYISRGTGYWGPPKRLGAPSEITRLRLVRAVTR